MKGRGTNEIEQEEYMSLKIQEATWEKRRTKCQGNHVHLSGAFIHRNNPVIDLKDEPVIQCDVPVVENTFVDDCK